MASLGSTRALFRLSARRQVPVQPRLPRAHGYATVAPSPSSPASSSLAPKKPTLLIIGSGWAGYILLRGIDKTKYDVRIVSPNSYFAMTPLLASAATGSLHFRNVLEPVRETAETIFYHAWCDSIDFEARKVHLTPAYPPPFRAEDPTLRAEKERLAAEEGGESEQKHIPNARGGHSSAMVRPPHRRAIEGADKEDVSRKRHHSHDETESWKSVEEGRQYTLPYDYLCIAPGAYNRTFNTPGVAENAWFLKDVQNARAIRWRILECFEQAEHPDLDDEQRRALLNFIIVGAGPTGSELAAALHDLVSTDIKRIFPGLVPLCKITLVDAADSILNSFDESLQTYARQQFDRNGIALKLGRKPVRVERGKFVCEPDGEVPFGLLVWSTGNTQGPLVNAITEIKKDKAGALLTDGGLRVLPAEGFEGEKLEGVYSLGDCAQVEGYALPATAQVASQK